MNNNTLKYHSLKIALAITLLLNIQALKCQKKNIDTINWQLWNSKEVEPTYTYPLTIYSSGYSIYHFQSKEDSLFYDKHSDLITSDPSEENYSIYFKLACAAWDLSDTNTAEKMFLKIIDSNEPFYTETYYNSSDIPGDTNTNTYGYGSFTSNYKNKASRYLCEIYIEKGNFELALKYLKYADKKFRVSYSCGTGNMNYRSEINGLYRYCYEGLHMYDSIISMFLSNFYDYSVGIHLSKAIKKTYSQEEIDNHLEMAVNSIVCIVDTFQSSYFITYNYGKENEKTIEHKYTSGNATITLFGKLISFPIPEIEEGGSISREIIVKIFLESSLYQNLKNNNISPIDED